MSAAAIEREQMELRLFSINDMPHVWDQVEPLLQIACEHTAGEFTPNIVLAGMGLNDGVEILKMLALTEGDRVSSIMVVCLSVAPNGKKSLECLLTAGEDVRSWMPFEPQMDEWARSLGCAVVRIPRGRKGWLKALPHWRIAGYVLEREL